MAGPSLPTNVDTTYADNVGDASQKTHQQHHDLLHLIANLFDTANVATSGLVPVGNGTTLVTRALTSADVSGFAEAVDDRTAALLVGGTAITVTYNDGANTLTIAVTAPTRRVVTASTTAVAGDVGNVIEVDAAGATTVTIPTGIGSDGRDIGVRQRGVGQVTVAQGAGFALASSGSAFKTAAQGALAVVSFTSSTAADLDGYVAV